MFSFFFKSSWKLGWGLWHSKFCVKKYVFLIIWYYLKNIYAGKLCFPFYFRSSWKLGWGLRHSKNCIKTYVFLIIWYHLKYLCRKVMVSFLFQNELKTGMGVTTLQILRQKVCFLYYMLLRCYFDNNVTFFIYFRQLGWWRLCYL